MLRAARVARGPHPATPASATPTPLRLPSRAPAVPSSPGPLSVAYRSAAQLALPCTFSVHSERGRKPLDLRPRALLGHEISRSANQLPRRGFSSGDSVASAKTSTGERTFNLNGSLWPENSKQYYYVDPMNWNKDVLLPMVDNNLYRMLYGPSQCGKTTRTLAFCKWLNQEKMNEYLPMYVSMENVPDGGAFWHRLGLGIRKSLTDTCVRTNIPLPHLRNSGDFRWWLRQMREAKMPKPVFFFDEADGIREYTMLDEFLRLMQALKMSDVQAAFFIGRFLVSELNIRDRRFSPFN